MIPYRGFLPVKGAQELAWRNTVIPREFPKNRAWADKRLGRNTKLKEKVILITGATNGIGLAAARDLARMGAQVIGVGRSPERCEKVQGEIRNLTGNDQVNFLCADLSSQADVRALAEMVRSRTDRLHVLINNAGVFIARREVSVDGIEKTFALNHLGHFLLTNLLFDLLKAGGTPDDPARIINVASEAEKGGKLDEAVLLGQTKYQGFQAYASSKLCNIVFTYELDRRRNGASVVANALHPGLVATNFGLDNFKGLLTPVADLYRKVSLRFVRSPEKGADTIVWLASAPETAQFRGLYFYDRKPIRSLPESYDLDAGRKLWELSERLTGLNQESR